MVCVDPHDIPIIAIVDPDMMSTMPKGLTAATGMDALTHAIEGYITAGAWELSDMFHIKAIEIIAKNLRGAVANTPEGREGMALGQYVAGMGFSNVGLGIVHSMAHPLGALYDTPHGVANAIILPTVMEYNAPATGEKYREIARAMGVKGVDDMTQEEYRKAAIDAVKQLSEDVGIPADLKDIVGSAITMEKINKYGDKAAQADFLLFNLGWDKYWGTDAYFGNYPCVDEEVLDYIIAGNFKGIGFDVIGLDPIADGNLTRHKKLFAAKDIVNIENLRNLDQCGDELLRFSCCPLKLDDCDGSPIRAIAWFD